MSVQLDPPLRVMALHALAYCERLFYLEEVEEIRVADHAVYAGRTLHEELRQAEEERGEWTSVEMASESLGLVGKTDCLRRRDGSLIPYEHKRGRPCREGKHLLAWPSDALQVSAYGMLLEEHLGRTVSEGRIRYHAENATVRVPLDEAARQSVRNGVNRVRALRASPERPAIAENDRLCLRCSLAPVCLPEEERLVTHPRWEPVRMFPAEREATTLHVVSPGAKVSRSGNQFKVTQPEGTADKVPVHDVGSVVLHGFSQMTTQALHLCAQQEIPVHWISGGGYYVAGLAAKAGQVQRRLRQYNALADPGVCLRLTRRLAMAKVETALRYLLRATRGTNREETGVARAVEVTRESLRKISHAEGVMTVRGHEGMAARAYFDVLPQLLRSEVPSAMHPNGRNRRPPRDRFNALLSFGYALIYQNVLQAILAVGLEPALGFFHTPRSAAQPLVLDLMELFRVPLWDMPLVGSVNRLQWDTEADFEVTPGRVWLSAPGRKKAIRLFETRLNDTWRHPAIGYSLSYARLIELEVRLLEKEWTGRPGLFAQMRLR
ncbi:MAG: type I-MYXAN CRISPR-associated endonuclease Cas1 [Planctomycetota bacterium]